MRRRLVLAGRGHKLLQDKLEEMMRRFLILLKDIDRANADFQERTRAISSDLVYSRITASPDDFSRSLAGIESRVSFDTSTQRIMNVRVPVFKIKELFIEKKYDFFRTSAQLDMVAAGAKPYLESLLRLAALLKTLDILASEIERTRRRVNALEYMLIPSIEETNRWITQKLNELELGNTVRLMRVKEIVRSH